ncbi:MAG: helix-hairpin-helix domain-containing protein [Acidobacteriales bacterium]|nr:helix-hairpin-helix domain-containing protein [Terriglobales bacterium]
MSSKRDWKLLQIAASLLLACALLLAGCSKQEAKDNTEKVREETAKATAEVKKNTKAVVEGVKEGWNRDKTVNVNAASKSELMILPGVTDAKADLIIDRRPYADKRELVAKKVLSESEYAKVADRVVLK